METLPIVMMLFIVLDIASFRWGFDSTEPFESTEWERPVTWHGWAASDPSRPDTI